MLSEWERLLLIVILLVVFEVVLEMDDAHLNMHALLASVAVQSRIDALIGVTEYPTTIRAGYPDSVHTVLTSVSSK
jgi:hypothetical protein